MKNRIAISAACITLAAGSTLAQDVAIAAAASGSLTDCRYIDVRDKLLASGLFNSVTIIDVVSTTPTAPDLSTYDALITWSNVDYDNATALGDAMAEYVDQGGAVVMAVFANSSSSANRSLGGRWATGNYNLIRPNTGNKSGAATLGLVNVPEHPIMDGVHTFSGGTSSFRPNATDLSSGTTEIAQWSEGTTLIAVGANPRRVDLGFYPPSDSCASSFWTQGTDGDRILANALCFAAGFCTGQCVCDQFDVSTGPGVCDIFDFLGFQNAFVNQEPLACDCDTTTGAGVCDIFDFLCFQDAFVNGCP